jgi:hypothetical protein
MKKITREEVLERYEYFLKYGMKETAKTYNRSKQSLDMLFKREGIDYAWKRSYLPIEYGIKLINTIKDSGEYKRIDIFLKKNNLNYYKLKHCMKLHPELRQQLKDVINENENKHFLPIYLYYIEHTQAETLVKFGRQNIEDMKRWMKRKNIKLDKSDQRFTNKQQRRYSREDLIEMIKFKKYNNPSLTLHKYKIYPSTLIQLVKRRFGKSLSEILKMKDEEIDMLKDKLSY